jgi:transcriptional regulator with XRE-family HTH domain
VSTTIGENIKRLRKARGWTQYELGERVGLPVSIMANGHKRCQIVSRIETGAQSPTISVCITLAEVFGVPVSDLLGDDAAPPLPAAEPTTGLGTIEQALTAALHEQALRAASVGHTGTTAATACRELTEALLTVGILRGQGGGVE